MKKNLVHVLILAFFVSVSFGMAFAEETPNLVGHWHGKAMMHSKQSGFQQNQEPTKLIIEKQQGKLITGKKIWVSNGKEMSENFSGAISAKNEKIYIAEHEDGLVIGDILSKNKIVIYYIEDGANGKVIMTELERVK